MCVYMYIYIYVIHAPNHQPSQESGNIYYLQEFPLPVCHFSYSLSPVPR